jgi:hypothetical protein
MSTFEKETFFKDALIEHHPSLANKLGLTPTSKFDLQQLGKGAFGEAYLTKSGHVVKLTTDRSEARVSARLKGKKLKHISNIYGVYKLPRITVQNPKPRDEHDTWELELYVIIQERLYPLSKEEFAFFERVSDQTFFEGHLLNLKDVIYRVRKDNHHIFSRNDLPMLVMCYNTAKYLNKIGVELIDIHQRNVLKDKRGNFKIIDLMGNTITDIPLEDLKEEQRQRATKNRLIREFVKQEILCQINRAGAKS